MRNVILGIAAALLLAGNAGAQSYPNKPVHIVVPWPPGGIADMIGRILGEEMRQSLGQPVVVENRPGASGKIGTEYVANAAPDGYTILFTNPSNQTTPVVAMANPSFDPVKDFTPIIQTSATTYFLVVSAKSPYKTAKDLVDAAKAAPGKLNYANAGIGSVSHFAIEMFLHQAGIKVVSVPYRGEGPAVTDVIAGAVQMMFMTGAKQYVDDGRIRALGTASAKPWFNLPDVPPIAQAAGVPGFVFEGYQGFVGPAKMPNVIRDKLNAAANAALKQPKARKALLDQGIQPVGGKPELIGDAIKNDMVKFRQVIADAHLKLE